LPQRIFGLVTSFNSGLTFARISVQKSGGVGDESPSRKKVGGRRPPASPPHYTRGAAAPLLLSAGACCYTVNRYLRPAGRPAANPYGTPLLLWSMDSEIGKFSKTVTYTFHPILEILFPFPFSFPHDGLIYSHCHGNLMEPMGITMHELLTSSVDRPPVNTARCREHGRQV